MNDKNEENVDQSKEKKSLPVSSVLGPVIGSLFGLTGGLLFGNIVWGQVIGLSLGILSVFLWPLLNTGGNDKG